MSEGAPHNCAHENSNYDRTIRTSQTTALAALPRATRAAFWFQRMRYIVATAADWPALPIHPAQTAHAHPAAGVRPNSTQFEQIRLHF